MTSCGSAPHEQAGPCALSRPDHGSRRCGTDLRSTAASVVGHSGPPPPCPSPASRPVAVKPRPWRPEDERRDWPPPDRLTAVRLRPAVRWLTQCAGAAGRPMRGSRIERSLAISSTRRQGTPRVTNIAPVSQPPASSTVRSCDDRRVGMPDPRPGHGTTRLCDRPVPSRRWSRAGSMLWTTSARRRHHR